MQSIYTPTLILPDSIADEKILAAAQALNEQLRLLSGDVKQTLFIPRLDELTGTTLDLLAWAFHVDFYNPVDLTDTQKRNLIRQSIAAHRRKGTGWSVLQVLKEFFASPTISRTGDFLFRVKTKGYTSTPEAFPTFKKMFFDMKNVRSWLDYLELDMSPQEPLSLKVGTATIINGSTTIEPARPKDSKQTIKVGSAILIGGDQTIEPAYPPLNNKILLHAGCSLIIEGSITIRNADQPNIPLIYENPNADLLIADVGIAR